MQFEKVRGNPARGIKQCRIRRRSAAAGSGAASYVPGKLLLQKNDLSQKRQLVDRCSLGTGVVQPVVIQPAGKLPLGGPAADEVVPFFTAPFEGLGFDPLLQDGGAPAPQASAPGDLPLHRVIVTIRQPSGPSLISQHLRTIGFKFRRLESTDNTVNSGLAPMDGLVTFQKAAVPQ